MKQCGGEVEVSRRRHARRDARLGDEGIGLVDILFSFVVLMICFVPMLKLIPVGSQVIATSADQRLAASIAESQLQGYAEDPPSPPNTSYDTSPAYSRTPVYTTDQDGTVFYVYEAEGWCASSAAPGNGTVPTSLTTQPPTYHYVVKVTWSRNPYPAIESDIVVDSVGIDTSTNEPTVAGTAINSCPLVLS